MSEYKYYIKRIEQPFSGQLILEVGNLNGSPVFNFRPGQYAMISYRNSQGRMEDKHAFSIASSPTNKNSIIFGIKIQGLFTQGLLQLKEGEELTIFGPYGNFVYDAKKYPDLVMLSGGIGITPFFSALNYATDLKLPNKLTLIYSTRTLESTTFFNEIKSLQKRNSNIYALFSFTEETGQSEDKYILCQRIIDAQIIKNFVGEVSGKTFFICGPSPFMKAMVAHLLSLGVSEKQIKMEEFSMIPDKLLGQRFTNFFYATGAALVLFIIFLSLIGKNNIITENKSVVIPVSGIKNIQPTTSIVNKQPSQIVIPARIFTPPPRPRTRMS